jgi:serine/threonine-protein kinase RsbW
MTLTREVSMSIDSRLENTAPVGEALQRMAEELGFSEAERYNLELCLVEALTNSIRHAYAGAPGHPVTARFTVLDERLEIRVLDEGAAVPEDKRVPRDPDFDPDDLASVPEGGLGTFLIHALMDHVEYLRDGSSNVLLMTKALPGRGGVPEHATSVESDASED